MGASQLDLNKAAHEDIVFGVAGGSSSMETSCFSRALLSSSMVSLSLLSSNEVTKKTSTLTHTKVAISSKNKEISV